jgi:hypothetical protein
MSRIPVRGFAMVLEREIATYRERLPELLARRGEFVVILGSEVLGYFPTMDKALEAGYAQTLTEAFLVREIQPAETVYQSSRNLRPCLSEPPQSTDSAAPS